MGSLHFFESDVSKDRPFCQKALAQQFNAIAFAFHYVSIAGTLMLSEWTQPQLHCAQMFPYLFPLPSISVPSGQELSHV